MLLLDRKIGECIRIGDNIKVYVIESKTNRAKLGIEAPEDVPVHREEVYQKIHEPTPGGDIGETLAHDD